jgi:hypothetical protein
METNYTLEEITNKYSIILEEGDDKELFLSIMNGKFDKDKEYDEPLTLTYIGIYYQFIKQPTGYDYKSMEKYYLKALDNYNHTNNNFKYYVMFSLGRYYQISKQYDTMKKYYQMVIDNTNQSDPHYTVQYASLALGNYYRSIEKPNSDTYKLMIKYYLMTIDYNNNSNQSYNKFAINAMIWLADYYKNIEINYDLMKKYLEMAVNNNGYDDANNYSIHAMKTLGYYYKNIEKNNILMEKYLLMAIEKATSKPIKSNISIMDECLSSYGLN